LTSTNEVGNLEELQQLEEDKKKAKPWLPDSGFLSDNHGEYFSRLIYIALYYILIL
jgi:hypothetical protein